MSPFLILGVPLFSIFWSLYWLVVRPARKQRRAAATLEPRLPEGFVPPSAALAPPAPNSPRDTSRTYPRPARSRSKLNRVCPVCGMEDPGNLDEKLLGWPAHHSCAEWLGDWKPSSASSKTVKSRLDCDGCGGPLGTGVRYHDTEGHHYCPDCDRKGYGRQPVPSPAEPVFCQNGKTDPIVLMTQQGVISLDEAREQLQRNIVASFSVSTGALEEHTHKVGDPVPAVRCTCGAVFYGTPEYLTRAMELHRKVGCRQSPQDS